MKNYIIDILVRSSAVTLVFVAGIYFFRISEDINNLFTSFYKKISHQFDNQIH